MDVDEARKLLLDLFVVVPERDITEADREEARNWPVEDQVDYLAKARANELEEGLVAVTLNGLIPAIRAMASSGTVIEGFGISEKDGELTLTVGPAGEFTVSVTAPEGEINQEVAVIRSNRDPMFSSGLAAGRVFTLRGRNCGSGRMESHRTADFLAFCESMRPLLAVPHEPRPDIFIRNRFDLDGSEAAAALTQADGGLPGENWKSILTAQRAAHHKLMMPIWAAGIARVYEGLMDLGYRWGEKYLAYNDTDIRTFAIPFGGGTALFYENIDIADEFTGLVAVVRTDGEGRPATFEIHPMDREKDSPSAFAESLVSGTCNAVPAAEIDLRTGSIGRTDLLNPHRAIERVSSVVGTERYIIADLKNGKKFDGGIEESTCFDDLEPWQRNGNDGAVGMSP